MHRFLIALALVLLLPACGQKGNLYLPEERETVSTPASAATSPDAASPEASADADAEARRRAARGAAGN